MKTKLNIPFVTLLGVILLVAASGPSILENFSVRISPDATEGQILRYDGSTWVNVTPTGKNHSGYGDTVYYVASDGDDARSGLYPWDAKRSVAVALNELNGGRKTGTIFIGPGIFTEPPMVIGERIRIRGTAPEGGRPVHGGTTIRLADKSNAPLFTFREPAPGAQNYQHYTTLSELSLDGNREKQDKPSNILELDGGGFNCTLEHLHFRETDGWAIWVDKKAINLQMSDITGSFCGVVPPKGVAWNYREHGGFLCLNLTEVPAGDTILISGMQLDACGVFPVLVRHAKGIGGTVIIDSYKLETGGQHGHNAAAIGYIGADGPHDRTNIIVRGARSDNYANGTRNNEAFFYQMSGKSPAHVILQQVGSSGDLDLYKNAVTGETISARSSAWPIAMYSNIGQIWAKDLTLDPPVFESDNAAKSLAKGSVFATPSGDLKIKK